MCCRCSPRVLFFLPSFPSLVCCGRHAVSYFFAKDASMLPQLLLGPLVYCVVFLNITSPRASFSTYYWALFGECSCRLVGACACACEIYVASRALLVGVMSVRSPIVFPGVYYVAAGFAYIVSIMAPPSLAQLVGWVL